MTQKRMIKYAAASLMLVAMTACVGKAENAASDVQETALEADTGVSTNDDSRSMKSEALLDSTYYYYPDEGDYMYNVIELISKGSRVCSGYFWGTDRDFWDNVEPCLPGFIVVPMEDIHQKGDTLTFVLDTHGRDFYSAPVSIYVHDPMKEHCDSLHKWRQYSDNCWDTVKYTTVLNKKGLTIIGKSKYWYWDDKPRKFEIVNRDSLAKILPPMPEEDEKDNRWTTE